MTTEQLEAEALDIYPPIIVKENTPFGLYHLDNHRPHREAYIRGREASIKEAAEKAWDAGYNRAYMELNKVKTKIFPDKDTYLKSI